MKLFNELKSFSLYDLTLIKKALENNIDDPGIRHLLCKVKAMLSGKAPNNPYITPEQYKNLTGDEWPDEAAVYITYADDSECEWFSETYGNAKGFQQRCTEKITVIIATAAGLPPDDWRPE